MLQAYSLNVDVAADGIIPFNNVAIDKGCAESLSGVGTVELNKCGVYRVTVDGTASAATTVQISKNGTPLPYAQATGTSIAFETFIQVDKNNCQCNVCSSPVTIQVLNSAAVTFTNVNITVDKVA